MRARLTFLRETQEACRQVGFCVLEHTKTCHFKREITNKQSENIQADTSALSRRSSLGFCGRRSVLTTGSR